MSEYGRLWERVAAVRSRLKELLPGVKVETLVAAREEIAKSAADQIAQIRKNEDLAQHYLKEWEQLEREMALTE